MRRAVAGTVAALALAVGPVAPVGASASQPPETHPEWGSVHATDGVLKRGCRSYRFTYEVTPPDEGYWDLAVTVVGPGRRTLFFGYVPEGSPRSGTASYRLCRWKTRPGRFKLKAVVTVMTSNEHAEGRLETVKYRLRNPR
jgi:hypothetical protein